MTLASNTATPTVDAIIEDLVEKNGGSMFSALGSIGLSELEPVPTSELFSVLVGAGIPCTREELAEVTTRHMASDGVFNELCERYGAEFDGNGDVVPFLAIMILCERLFPDWVSSDNYIKRSQEAFDLMDDRDLKRRDVDFAELARAFEKAWRMAVSLTEAWGVTSVAEFDRRCGLCPIADVAQALDGELEMASAHDAAMAGERRSFIQEFARLFGRDSVRVLEADVEPDGSIMAEYEMYMLEPTGTVFDGIIDDELLERYPFWE